MYKVGVVTKTMQFLNASFETKEEVDEYLLIIDDSDGLKKFRIEKDGVLIETEQGKKDDI